MTEPLSPASAATAARFAVTHWSAVLRAGADDSRLVAEALEELCRVYWFPFYAFARHRGCSPADAQDLTQAFFARLLEHNLVGRADAAEGRFRADGNR